MLIEYKDGQKTITHKSGVVSKYSKQDVIKQRKNIQDQIDRLQLQLAIYDADIVLIDSILGK